MEKNILQIADICINHAINIFDHFSKETLYIFRKDDINNHYVIVKGRKSILLQNNKNIQFKN